MKALIQGLNGSTLEVDKRGLTIHLPSQLFGNSWLFLLSRLAVMLVKGATLSFRQRIMTLRGSSENAPRWRENRIDGLSWLLFWLKVPADHEYVRLWEAIDWAQINQTAAKAYKNGSGGRPAWAPAQLVAMLILMFLTGIEHETTLARRLPENIVWCWFCGFSLFGPFPTHDALYEFRKRLGQEGFEQILTIAVQACLEAKLVKNELIHFDLTPSEASAHRWSPYERAVLVTRTLVRYLELSWASQLPNEPFPAIWTKIAAEVAIETLPHKSLAYVSPERVVASLSDWEEKHLGSPAWKEKTDELAQELFESEPLDEIQLSMPKTSQDTESTNTDSQEVAIDSQAPQQNVGESGKQNENDEAEIESANPVLVSSQELVPVEKPKLNHSQLSKIAKRVIKNLPHTRGDSDARVGRTTNYTWFCGYLMGFVVDNQHQVITAVVLGAGNTAQAAFFEPAIEAHMNRVGPPKEVALDSAFDQYPIHAYLDGRKITGHITSRKHSKPRDGGYGTDRVTWLPDEAHPRCAANKRLRLVSIRQDGNIYEGVDCPSCELYKLCYPDGQGKLKKYRLKPDEHRRWQENRTHNRTQEYKQAQRKRFVSEGRFGLAKSTHHAKRLPYRSERMNRLAALMIASVMNWRILARLAVIVFCLFSFLLES